MRPTRILCSFPRLPCSVPAQRWRNRLSGPLNYDVKNMTFETVVPGDPALSGGTLPGAQTGGPDGIRELSRRHRALRAAISETGRAGAADPRQRHARSDAVRHQSPGFASRSVRGPVNFRTVRLVRPRTFPSSAVSASLPSNANWSWSGAGCAWDTTSLRCAPRAARDRRTAPNRWRCGRRWSLGHGVVAFADEARGDQPFEVHANGRAAARRRSSPARRREIAPERPALNVIGISTVSISTILRSSVVPTEESQSGVDSARASFMSAGSRVRLSRSHCVEEIPPSELAAITLAQCGAGKPVNEARVPRIQQKDKRQQTLQRLGIDVGLVRRGPSAADQAPISDGEMVVAVLHGRRPWRRCISLGQFAPSVRRLHPRKSESRAKSISSKVRGNAGRRSGN